LHLLIENTRILNSDFSPTDFSAVLCIDGKITNLLTSKAARQHSATHRFDAKGYVLFPSFMDSHIHLLDYGLRLRQLNLSGLSFQESVEVVSEKTRKCASGEWILGGGWMRNYFGDFPKASDLDAISTHHFIALSSKDSHCIWVNSKTGALLNPNDFSDAEIPRDSSGKILGLLFERAAQKLSSLPQFSLAEKKIALKEAQEKLFQFGITEVISIENASALDPYHSLGDELKLRVHLTPYLDSLDATKKFFASSLNPKLSLNAVKFFLDGSLGAETCSLLDTFEGKSSHGIDLYADSDLVSLFRLVEREGLNISVHAIGDKAVRRALKAFEVLQKLNPRSRYFQHRIEHAQMIHPDDLSRFARLGIIASMQPIHIKEDIATATRLLGARCERLFPFQSLLRTGAVLTFGSDAPIETPNVIKGIYYAVKRCDKNGVTWYGSERLSLAEALYAYTSAPHLLTNSSSNKGKLAPGYAANLVLLPRSFFKEVDQTSQPFATICGGEVVMS
jgi:predicted amidohydrolase YtcJ